jgi:hypothetical protein
MDNDLPFNLRLASAPCVTSRVSTPPSLAKEAQQERGNDCGPMLYIAAYFDIGA